MEIEEKANISHIKRSMVDHVFLHRKLLDNPFLLLQTGLKILQSMTHAIEKLQHASVPSVVRQMFINMKQLHCEDVLDPEAISNQLKSMESGDMLGIYAREQNCGLFIHMNGDGVATLSTFCASLPNEMIYGGEINGDIQVDYPTRAIKVQQSMMSEEFATQIHYLSGKPMDRAMPKSEKAGHKFAEIRNVPHPMYVSQWLMAIASNRSTEVDEKFPIISKKIRDEVIKGEETLPFRRSGFYTAMKVFLQLGLTIELGAECGRFAYKLVMLKFMSGLCADHSVDADIAIQMLAKMARRIDKIESLASSVDELSHELITFKSTVINDVREIIRIERGKLDAIFDAIRKEECRASRLEPMPRLEFERDIRHQIPNLLAFIEKRKGEIESEPVDNYPKPRKIVRHAWDNMDFPDDNLFGQVSAEIDVLQLLADIEHWVLFTLDCRENFSNEAAKQLRRLATAYMSKAHSFYEKDCFGYSKLVLLMLKIIQIMDKATVEEYPRLREHSSGINPKIIETLFLSSQAHLKIAQQLQIYFEDRNAGAQFPGLLEEDKLSRLSFSARYAESNAEMQEVRQAILAMAERRIEDKRAEWENARKEVAEMRSRYSRMACTYYTDGWNRTRHSNGCSKCSLNRQINNYTVQIYERPLKPEEHNQNGVVFELLMPKKIECLRDVLHLFVNKHSELPLDKMEIHGNWTAYDQITQHNRSAAQNAFLGSSIKLTIKSHYRDKHPEMPFLEFIVDNGYNCTFYGSDGDACLSLPTDRSQQSVKKYVTFSVENPSVYSSLQWTLIGSSHTQNEVLTKQCDCPANLSLNEFVKFGSLRADGHRLQLRNLYRVLETEGLSFETQSVLALVMQSLWEAGPLDAERSKWYREAHEDFADSVFASAMIELLEKYVEQQASNWKHPVKLVVAATIAVKVFEINGEETIADRIAKLLVRIRGIVIDWISQISDTIGRCPNEQSRAAVYANLVEVAACGIFTYNVNRHHLFFDKIFSEGPEHSSLFTWLRFMVTINNNMLLHGNQYSGIKRTLIRLVFNVGVNAEAKIKTLIQKNSEEVYELVRTLWSESLAQAFERIQNHVNAPQIIFMAVRSEDACNYVQIDLVAGEFLVNNCPVANLPKSITDHPLFQRVFGGTIFEVQPSDQSFSTVYKYDGFNYIFRLYNGLLIITEQRTDGNIRRELIPPEILKDEIPYLLIENHSHWWDEERGIIEFRPTKLGSQDFSAPNGIEYELDLNKFQLKHLKTKKLLLDICSQSYKRIVSFLSRLDQQNYIHVLMDKPAKAIVHFMRMNLKFVIDCSSATEDGMYDIESNEYRGMRVSLDQTLDTLIGLQNGLLLEAIPTMNKSNSKLFVMPHGQVNIGNDGRHVSVDIDLVSQPLRKPTFFIFPVDTECRQIKANNYPGWFYLAYLHAVTSCSLPDPFTGMTGTERALQILQSARVWSPSPYDEESIATLRLIAGLTPVRTFYPSHLRVMQQIQWPAAIPSTAAQDSYLLIVQKLISDSQRLPQLYFQEEKTEVKTESVLLLNERDQARHLPYNPNWNISNKFIQPRNILTKFEATEDDENVAAVRQLSVVYVENSFFLPSNVENSIYRLLIEQKKMCGVSSERILSVIDYARSSDELMNLWIRLYDFARTGHTTREREKFQLILSYLAYEGKDINQLFILQAIAANAQEFASINPPPFHEYEETGRNNFERATIMNIVKSTEMGLLSFLNQKSIYLGSESYKRQEPSFHTEYAREIADVTGRVADYVNSNWPCDEVEDITFIQSDKLRINDSIARINAMLRNWNNNRKLLLFIREVEAKLKQLRGTTTKLFSPDRWPIFNVEKKPFPKYAINFEEKLSRNFKFPMQNVDRDIHRAKQIFVGKNEENDRTLEAWWELFKDISVPCNEKHMFDSGLYPHLVPSLVFPQLVEPICEQRKYVIGAIAVMTTREQRRQRIERFDPKYHPQMKLTLRRERENQPQVSWMPHERPEWLLFEIEMDLSIRQLQVEIAERMIKPPDIQHSVMQLNMGEGKTSVIVPILAAVLADGNRLCTVTVLKSLFHTNLRSLRQCLGGMLNRRIYTFPCRRDMQIEAVAGDLLSIYDECKRERGVVMTLPEYRLSFQLKIYEAARKGDTSSATNFLNVHKWLNRNARHILDESDAILDAKYQLIYTVGAQLPPDGGALRWTIAQAVLKRVPHHMQRLFQLHGEQRVEFNHEYRIGGVESTNRPEVFRPCRLLDESVYGELSDALIDDFLHGELNISFPEMRPDRRLEVRNILRNPKIGHEQHAALMNHFDDSQQKTLLILNGLFKFGVLKLALLKRWRVNYGVNMTGRRKMAVPFRAKDVAAEMTEFGHPDVAICLTHLSYYYSGLTDEQLYETFDVLALTENPEDFYDEWVRSIPRHLVAETITVYGNINLSDPDQRDTQLFPLLRFNMHVIDYWLSNRVFPREAKIFDSKLMCTAWDLCSEHLEHVVTGFSGTNDTKLLLPMLIKQNDLRKLKETNKNVRNILLREENNHYRAMRSNVSGMEILHQLVADGIPVLLDAGALMLELNNEQTAREWLELASIDTYDAAIFFSKDDILMTIDRNGFITEFEYSVYRERLGRCLVYLDDVHTRGTDLKFPSGIRACVTLSGRITRDKTVQACMRMRMLGQGHMVSFYASLEADIGIRALIHGDDEPNTSHVIEYITANSENFAKDGLIHWSAAGLNYTQKLAAHKHFEESMALNELSTRCIDPENTPLIEMYGAKEVQVLTLIMQNQFNRIAQFYNEQQSIFNWIGRIGDGIVSKLREYNPDTVRYSQLLDEEQEKELEHELEEQREISRPPPMKPMIPRLNPLLKELFTHGKSHSSFAELRRSDALQKLPFAFVRAKLFSIMQPESESWENNIFVTEDFLTVAELAAHDQDDEFLRPVWWIAQVSCPESEPAFVLLSTFECNALLPTFRSSKKSILHMFCPKLSMSHSNLLNDGKLQLPAKSSNVAVGKAIQIAIFAGSWYFNDQQEEIAYCNFMGFIPRPRSLQQQQAFDEGAITSSGYVPTEHRARFPELDEMCRFTENPDKIAIGIIERRHGYLNAKSHVASLFLLGRRVLSNANN